MESFYRNSEKLFHHINALFGKGVADGMKLEEIHFEYSKKTGRIKNFSISNQLMATLRTDGGIALTIFGAQELLKIKQFKENCIIPTSEALPFVSEGKSLFCKHVEWCGSNIKAGSDVAIIDKNNKVVGTGVALFAANIMKKHDRGVAVKIREGIKSRAT